MSAPVEQNPQTARANLPSRAVLVGLRINPLFTLPEVRPANNHAGRLLLGRVLTLRMEAENILLARSGDATAHWTLVGELNQCMGFAVTSNWRRATEIIREEVNVGLVGGEAAIAWFDPAEAVWRITGPEWRQGEVIEDFLPDVVLSAHVGVFKAAMDFTAARVRWAKEAAEKGAQPEQ